MEVCGEELASVQTELQGVKKALRDGGEYLGMKGEPLHQYFLRLHEKENLLISEQLQRLTGSGSALGKGHGNGAPALGGATPSMPATSNASASSAARVREEPAPKVKDLPEGPVKAFDRDSLQSVVAHMQEYEASVAEATKALRALSSLAYASASEAGNDRAALPQLLRLLLIHPDSAQLHLAAMRSLCNMAYDQDVALRRLVAPEVLAALMDEVARNPAPTEVGMKASEALARIVAAETRPEEEDGTPKEAVAPEGPGALGGLFLVACRWGPAAWQGLIPQLLAQLVGNEVVEPRQVAERFAAVAVESSNALTAAGWMGLTKLLCACDLQDLAELLTDAGAILQCTRLMEAHLGDVAVQLGGIEAMSSLVGSRWSGLQAFADVAGMRPIEAAMRAHPNDGVIQTKGMRALASGILWPEDVQAKSGYDGRRSMELTRSASSAPQHGDNEELQVAALEALAKYVEIAELAKEFAGAGGEQLIRAIMHKHSAASKAKTFGKQVLDSLQRTA